VPRFSLVLGEVNLGREYFEKFDVLMTRRVLHPFATVFYAERNLGFASKT